MTRMSAVGAWRRIASRIAAAVVAVSVSTPRGGGDAHRARDERHGRAAVARRLGDRDAHLPARAVADEADRVDRLTRAAGAHHDPHPVKVAGPREQPLDRIDDRRRLGEAPDAGEAARERPDLRLDDPVAEAAQRLDVALRGRVGPHAGVHGRRHAPPGRGTRRRRRSPRPGRGPAARTASRLAVAGAMTIASAASASSMWAICCSPSSSSTSSTTGRWVRLSNVSGADELRRGRRHRHVDHRAALGEQAHER